MYLYYKSHLSRNLFYAILNNNRSRLLHVSTNNPVTSLQVVRCGYWTIAVTGTVALCVLLTDCNAFFCMNNYSKIFNRFTDIYRNLPKDYWVRERLKEEDWQKRYITFTNLTFRWLWIVKNSCNEISGGTNFLKLMFGIKLYMFRTVSVSIIGSFSLYTQQCFMLYRLTNSLRTNCQPNQYVSLCVQF